MLTAHEPQHYRATKNGASKSDQARVSPRTAYECIHGG